MQHHYILTDDKFRISNISERLATAVGLNSKFFSHSQNIFAQSICIETILGPEMQDPDYQRELERSGIETHINTTSILELVNLEYLTEEEINEARAHIGIYPVHVQLKTFVYDPNFCTLRIYRVIFLPNVIEAKNTDSLKESASANQNSSISKSVNQKMKLAKNVFGISKEKGDDRNISSLGDEGLSHY